MIKLNGNSLTLEDVGRVANALEEIQLSDDAIHNMELSHSRMESLMSASKPVYGLNTGFGIFADQRISSEESRQLNRNLILSHAVGTGEPLPKEVVKAAMLIRANTLAKGFSGIRVELVNTLLNMLNRQVVPIVCSKGSLGSSGDLCMLAQMALVMAESPSKNDRETGKAFYGDAILDGRTAMQKAGIKRILLSGKEGLAVINGATFSAAMLALAAWQGDYFCKLADIAAALSFEALLGRTDALHPILHAARGLSGQIESAEAIRDLLKGSQMADSHEHVQDAYSLRCAPQVHGAVRETLRFAQQITQYEINAATDNPLVVGEEKVVSGGNFHGEMIGMAADFLSIAMSELASISERRIFRLMDENLNYGLPSMLIGDEAKAGLNSGIMMLQYTAAALVLENQTLCSPDSVRSLPTSANQEDFNANAWNAALHLKQINENLSRVLTTEIYTACRAISIRRQRKPSLQLGRYTGQFFKMVAKDFPFQADDMLWKQEVDQLQTKLFQDTHYRDCASSVFDK